MEAKAVIFDYGGVICFFPSEEQVDELAARTGLAKDLFLKTYWSTRLDYDRGDLTWQKYWDQFARLTGRKFTEDQVHEFVRLDIGFWVRVDPRMIQWARALKESGRKIAVLSNMPREIGEYMRANFDWLREFDHITFSYEVRSVKPEPAIYHDAIDGVGVRAEETVFLDDRIENIRGAEAVGLRAVLFGSAETFSRSAREAHHFLGLGSAPVVLE
jgi:putative hydrolase of the HAD superfamily